MASINFQLDSLRDLGEPVDDLLIELPSIEQGQNMTLDTLIAEVEAFKLHVPAEIRRPELTSEQEKLEVPMEGIAVSTPEMTTPLGNQLSTKLPGLENPSDNVLAGTDNLAFAGSQEIAKQAGEYDTQFATTPSNIDDMSELAEKQAEKITEVTGVNTELNEAGKVLQSAGSLSDESAVKDELITQAQQQAVNHFEGQEEQLNAAMELVAKYKKKYGSFQSLEDIASRKGNPLRGTPFIERFIPGIAFQIHRRDAWLVDLNVYASYRLYPRITAGAGWNQRVAYDPDEYDFKPVLRIFGPRTFGEFLIGQGFSARLEAEYMNTRLPPQFSSRNADPNGREWVFTTMVGVKKEFRFFKDIKGTMMLMYNVYDPHHKSPYVDKLSTRFGFEFPMKRKPEKVQE